MLAPDQQEFLNIAIENAKIICQETGLIVSGQVAQACLESSWGRKKPGNNCYGIKMHKCPYVSGKQDFLTHEEINGVLKPKTLSFAGYKTLADCFRCHALILKKNFPSAYTSKTPEAYAASLHFDPTTKLSYATDSHYVDSLMLVVNSHKLRQYDDAGKQDSGTIQEPKS
jgi:flagellum-specific peptidoglycan hydrolase FlgJ